MSNDTRDIGAEILEGLEQAVSYMEGENTGPIHVHQVDLPDTLEVDVVAIRKAIQGSQGHVSNHCEGPIRDV